MTLAPTPILTLMLTPGDVLSYVWIGPDLGSVGAADGATTPAGGQLIVADPAVANKIYNNDVLGDGLTYSSPDIHTVRLQPFPCSNWVQ